MLSGLRSYLVTSVLYGLLCFPLFYFVYKFGTPFQGMIDFFDYYRLFQTMDFRLADSPLNMRLVASAIIYLMSKTGLYYDTICAIDNSSIDKVIYFNAVFFNFLCVVGTSVALFKLLRNEGMDYLLSFIGGLLYLLGFGTIFFQLMPLVDAFTTLCFTIILIQYNKRSYWAIPFLAIMILQREYLLMAFGLAVLIDFLYKRDKYYLRTFIAICVFFIVYVVLRKAIFETPRYAHHTDPDFMLDAITSLSFPLFPFIKQILMTLNIFLIYFGVICYKAMRKHDIAKRELIIIGVLFLEVIILAFLLGLGNNAGRYYYILTPMIIMALVKETAPLIKKLDVTTQRS